MSSKLRRLTGDRVREAMAKMDLGEVTVDERGCVVTHVLYNFVAQVEDGGWLKLTTKPKKTLEPELVSLAYKACNAFNRDRNCPAAYIEQVGDGLAVAGGMRYCLAGGVTDEQLDLLVQLFTVSCVQMWKELLGAGVTI